MVWAGRYGSNHVPSLSRRAFRGRLRPREDSQPMTVRFAAVGDNCIDRYLPPVGDCLVGGNAVNVAVHLARLGRTVGYFGAVGADAAGEAVRNALGANGVDTGGLRVVPGEATARTDIETLPDGDRRFVFESFGACAGYRPGGDDLPILRRMSHVHVGWLRGAMELRRALAGSGVVLSQDLGVNNNAADLDPAGLDIAFASAEPERAEAESASLLARGARLAVITLGAAGSLATDGRILVRGRAVAIRAVDATGAGDAFIGGFLDACAKGLNLNDCLAQGSVAGAAVCGHRGGFPQPALQPFVHDVRAGTERVLEPD